LHGNPNKRNARNETALHLVCKLSLNAPPSAQDRRLACVHLILQWKGGFNVVSGNIEQADLKAQDMVNSFVFSVCVLVSKYFITFSMVIQSCTYQLDQGWIE
jgi:hypothetical protein